MGIIILLWLHTYGRVYNALTVYGKTKKNTNTMYNHFKRWEKYQYYERSFVSIENIGFHGNYYFVLITYGRAEGALSVYEKPKKYQWRSQCARSKHHENSFKRWEKYGVFERYFISIENVGSHEIIILLSEHIVASVPMELVRFRRRQRCSNCIWKNQKYWERLQCARSKHHV